MVLGAVLFVLGFTAVFVTVGTALGGLGRLLVRYDDVITRGMGVVVIVVGLAFLGRLPFLQRTRRLSVRPVAGLAGAPLLLALLLAAAPAILGRWGLLPT
jgi:cytochrome c-type biogenesis protein